MYSFTLTLSDSARFVIDEHTDLGSQTTTGTWDYSKDIITLTPKKVYRWDRRFPEKEKKEQPIIHNEIIVSVDNQKRLKIISPKGDMTYTDKELDKIK